MQYGDYIKDSFDVFKANPAAGIVATLALIIPIVNLLVIVNYMEMVKSAKHEGKPMEIGQLFNFDHAVDRIVAPLIVGLVSACCFLIGFVLLFTLPILADKPGTPFMTSIKAAFAYGKANFVPLAILAVILGVVNMIGNLACGIGALVTTPVCLGAMFLAYDDNRAAVEAAAAEGGITL